MAVPTEKTDIGMSFTTMQERALGINGAFIGITITVMAVRLYVRVGLSNSMGWDDYLMVAGALTTIGLSINTIVAVHLGVGRLMAQIPLPWTNMLLAIFCARIFYCIAIAFVKTSLLGLYLRLEPGKIMRWILYFLMFNVSAVSIAGTVVSIIGCIPPEVFWHIMEDPVAAEEKCFPQDQLQTFWEVCGALVIAQDIAIWLIPIPMVWRLNFPVRLKWAVSGVFALGIFAVAASGVRWYYVYLLSGQKEQYYQLADSLNWCALELHVTIICASSSSIRAFFKRHFPGILSSLRSTGTDSRQQATPNDTLQLSNLSGGGGVNKVMVSSKRGKSRGYEVMNEEGYSNSEEAIIPEGRHIYMKHEVRQDSTVSPVPGQAL